MTIAVAFVVGYLLGSVSPATLLARRAGADLRASGSGNPGATNIGRVLGRKVGILVGLLDVAKGALPAAAFGLIDHRAGLVAGLAATLGHITSPWLRGHGGKGVATAAGAILGSHPLWVPVVLTTWLVALGLTRWVAFASCAAAAAVPVAALVVRSSGLDVAWALLLAALVVTRHRSNFARWRAARRAP